MNSFSPTDSLIGIGLTAAMLQQLIARPAYDGESPMRVIEMPRDAVCLHDGQHEVLAAPAAALVQALSDDAPGGRRLGAGRSASAAPVAVVERVPPTDADRTPHCNDGRGAATRAGAGRQRRHRVPGRMGLDHDFNPRRLERYLALTHLAAVRRWWC